MNICNLQELYRIYKTTVIQITKLRYSQLPSDINSRGASHVGASTDTCSWTVDNPRRLSQCLKVITNLEAFRHQGLMLITDLCCGVVVYGAVNSLRRLPKFPKNILP
jgi:hypothetical protein